VWRVGPKDGKRVPLGARTGKFGFAKQWQDGVFEWVLTKKGGRGIFVDDDQCRSRMENRDRGCNPIELRRKLIVEERGVNHSLSGGRKGEYPGVPSIFLQVGGVFLCRIAHLMRGKLRALDSSVRQGWGWQSNQNKTKSLRCGKIARHTRLGTVLIQRTSPGGEKKKRKYRGNAPRD